MDRSEPWYNYAVTGRLFAALLAGVIVVAVPGLTSASPMGSDPPPPTVPVANDFVPEDANLTDCVSALPRPECGSEARGGWRQGAVFGALALGLAIITWRIVVGVRRQARSSPSSDPAHRAPT